MIFRHLPGAIADKHRSDWSHDGPDDAWETGAKEIVWETAGLGKKAVSVINSLSFNFGWKRTGKKKKEQNQSGSGAWELNTVFVWSQRTL